MSASERLAAMFLESSQLMELLGEDSFRCAAYARASRAMEAVTLDISKLTRAELLKLEGLGPKTADKVQEFLATGQIEELTRLRGKVPAGLMRVLDIPGLGPKTVRAMWQQLNITDIASLEKAIGDGSLATLPRMGDKAIEKIKAGIAFSRASSQRMWLGQAFPIARAIADRLRAHPAVAKVEPAGSLRRGKETVADLDTLVALRPEHEHAASEATAQVMELFCTIAGVTEVITRGDTKCSVRMRVAIDHGRWGGEETGPTIQADLRVVPLRSFGAALMYFTGSKEHNIKLRAIAQSKGLTLNDWGLFKQEDWEGHRGTGATHAHPPAIAGATEEEVFAALGATFVPAEMREDRGEVGLTRVPELVTVPSIVSELHAHTTASDGDLSIEELAREAHARGFHTLAVTDHSQSSTIARGLKPDRLRTHMQDVRRIAAKLKTETGLHLFTGSEVDILSDGTLDYDDELLEQLDVVVASPHAALDQDPVTATKRLIKAIEHPRVRVLGHPTGRLINRRKGLEPAMSELFAAAKQHNVALEINSHWMRLDLRDVHVRGAVEAGCLIAINCDVHQRTDFDNLRFGVLTARRGWLPASRCVNTWNAATLHAWLRGS